MKTTIELPELLFRRAKAAAAHEGLSLKQLFTQALVTWLKRRHNTKSHNAPPQWERVYGALRHLHHERGHIEKLIKSEFEKIEPEDRL